MINEITIIAIWLITLVVLASIFGEYRCRCLEKNLEKDRALKKQKIKILNLNKEDIDAEFTKLSIEMTENDFVSMQTLSRRGSWRMAQNKVMGEETFKRLCDIEYSKSL